MRTVKSGGGFPAILYTLRKAREVGPWRLWKAMRTRNACKTCALGMGGQSGGMVNEVGHFPEVCKKSLQAMASDMQGAIGPEFFARYAVAQLQRFTPRELESCGRLTTPLLCKRGEDYYRPIAWDEALARIAGKLRETPPDETFWYFSGRSSNEAGFLVQLFARLYGTNNVNNCSYFCHQASGVGLSSSLGTGTATIVLDDLRHCDLVMLIGGNPASNHPRLLTTLAELRRRGGEAIVINPVVETGLVNFSMPGKLSSLLFGSRVASLYVQPDIGGDLALLTGVAKRIDEMGAVDEAFLRDHCDGWPKLAEHLRALTWRDIQQKCGVGQRQIDAIAVRYGAATNTIFAWTMGVTHHAHGVQNVQAIANLALMRGMVGRAGAGLLPIRGHSNVQGIGSVGVTPKLKDAVFSRLEQHFGVRLPTTRGLDTLACVEAAAEGRLKVGFCLGGNLYGSNPDARFAAGALSRLDMIVYLSTKLNTGHAHGLAAETIILPVLARDEEPQATTQESMFNFVRLSDGGPRRHPGPRSEIELVSQIALEVLGETTPVDWRAMADHTRIREAIGKIVPGFEPIGSIDRTKQEFQVGGRTLHAPGFPTPNGHARLHIHELPELNGTDGQLRLMTVRSEGQFNTVVYEDHDLYRGQERRDVILLNPDDIARLGLVVDQRVTVRSEVGSMAGVLVRSFPAIKACNALMYYPEANVLVPRHADPASRTPAFKSVAISIEVPTLAATQGRHTDN